jgi:hypothetical protein
MRSFLLTGVTVVCIGGAPANAREFIRPPPFIVTGLHHHDHWRHQSRGGTTWHHNHCRIWNCDG